MKLQAHPYRPFSRPQMLPAVRGCSFNFLESIASMAFTDLTIAFAWEKMPFAIERFGSAIERRPLTEMKMGSAVERKPSAIEKTGLAVERRLLTAEKIGSAVERESLAVMKIGSADETVKKHRNKKATKR